MSHRGAYRPVSTSSTPAGFPSGRRATARGGVPAGEPEVGAGGFAVEDKVDVPAGEQPEVQGDVDLVQHDDPVLAGEHRPEARVEAAPRPADVLIAGVLGDVDETPAAELADRDER